MHTGTTTLADGTVLAHQVTGLDDGPALLLLPGQANSHRWWDGLRDAFDDRFKVVTFDYRGTGSSIATEPTGGDWSTRLFADDAAAVLDSLGVESAHVYGTSMGGRVAQLLAADHPERVRRLVLACTSPGGSLAAERSVEIRRALSAPDPLERRTTLLGLMYTPARLARDTRSHLLGDPTMTPWATRQHLRVSGRHDAWDLLPSVTAPTLVLHGTDDAMSPVSNAHLIADRVPSATLWLKEGGRHGFFDEYADEVSPVVADFLG